MNTLVEIEAVIEQLPDADIDKLAQWIAQRRNSPRIDVEAWLQRARGAAKTGFTTESVLAMTRGEG